MFRLYLKFLFQLVLLMGVSSAQAGAYEDFFRALGIDNDREVASLLARGFDPNSRDEKGQPALTLALRDGSAKVVDLLLRHPQLSVDAPNAANETPLMMAALRGQLPAMKALLERGAAVNREGWTPLHYAASGPSGEAVGLLLDKGAAIDARSPQGHSALMMAARYGSEDAVLRLLQRNADLAVRNDRGQNAADFARLGGRDKLAEELARRAR